MSKISKTIKLYQDIVDNLPLILNGTIACIDPSIGSRASMPGWAIYTAGKLMASGTLEIDPTGSVPERLQELARLLRNLYSQFKPDVLVYEQLPVSGQGWAAQSYASLLKALGAILSVKGPRGFVGIHPKTWKRLTRANYVKSDEADAIEFGWITVEIAKEVQADQEAKGEK